MSTSYNASAAIDALMRTHAKFVSVIVLTILTVVVILYSNPKTSFDVNPRTWSAKHAVADSTEPKVSIWISVTKIDRGHLLTKFRKFFKSLLSQRGQCRAVFELNVITDNASRPVVDNVIHEFSKLYKETLLTVQMNWLCCIDLKYIDLFLCTIIFSWSITIFKMCWK